jgi:RAT1-interacting protein
MQFWGIPLPKRPHLIPGLGGMPLMVGPGYKFETLSTLPAPWGETPREFIENRETEQVNNKEQYCSVVRTGMGKTILCLGGEVDASMLAPCWSLKTECPFSRRPIHAPHPPVAGRTNTIVPVVWDSKPPARGAPINWVELKTTAEIHSERDRDAFERKLMKFWIQSFLLGVPKIIVGFRSRDGTLVKLEEIETVKIPSMVMKRGRGGWNADACINFASAFLDCKFKFPA